MIGNNRLGASAYVDAKPAIVSQHQVTYEAEVSRLRFEMESIDKTSSEFALHLMQFKEGGRWRKKFSSWEEASEKELGMTKQWSNKLISRFKHQGDPAPTNPTQPEKARENPNESQETPETEFPVQKSQNQNKNRASEPPATPESGHEPLSAKPPTDASGCVIPQKLLATRERRQEITDLEHKASVLHALFVKLQATHDPLFNHLLATGQVQTFASGAGSMRYALAECSPDVVCPQCVGAAAKCHICHGTGWISQVRWNRDWIKSHDTTKAAVVRERKESTP